MLIPVIGEIERVVFVADDKQLHEAQQRMGVAVAGVVAVLDDLLHRTAWGNLQGFQLDLHQRQAIDEQNHVIAVMTVISLNAQLIDDFKVVFAPVAQINQHVFQRRAVLAGEFAFFTQCLRSSEHIRSDNLIA